MTNGDHNENQDGEKQRKQSLCQREEADGLSHVVLELTSSGVNIDINIINIIDMHIAVIM